MGISFGNIFSRRGGAAVCTLAVLLICFSTAAAQAPCDAQAVSDATASLNDGMRAEAQGDLDTALRQYRAALNFCHSSAAAHLRIGVVRFKQSATKPTELGDGIAHLEQYLAQGGAKTDGSANRYLFHLYLLDNQTDKAEKTLRTLVDSHPNKYLEAYFSGMKMGLSGSAKDMKQALPLLESFIADPGGYTVEKAVAERTFYKLKYGDKSAKLFEARRILRGLAYGGAPQSCGDADTCVRRIIQLLEPETSTPGTFAEAEVTLAEAYMLFGKNRNLDKAEALFRAASSLREGHLGLIRLSYQRGQKDKAYREVDQFIAARPSGPGGYYWKGCLLLQTGNEDQAITSFVRAYELGDQGDYRTLVLEKLSAVDPGLSKVSATAPPALAQQIRQATQQSSARGERTTSDLFDTESYGGVVSSPHDAVLQVILKRISKKADLPEGDFRIVVLGTPRIQALAVDEAGTGSIYLTEGFLNFIAESAPIDENNGLLSFAIAHELAHLDLGHERASEIIAGSDADDDGDFRLRQRQELDADNRALYLSFLAGYDPSDALAFMEHFAARFQEAPMGKDHPTYARRCKVMIEQWKTVVAPAYFSFHAGVSQIETGLALEKQGNNQALFAYKRALESFEKFAGIFRDTKQAYNNIGYCHMKIALSMMEKDRIAPELKIWRLSTAYDPKIFTFKDIGFRSEGFHKKVQAELDEADKNFAHALRLDPNYPEPFLNQGCLYVLSKQIDKAIAHFEAGVKIKPIASGCLNNLGVIHASNGELDRALVRFENAARLDPDNPATIYNLCVLYNKTGKGALAQERSTQYMELETEPTGWKEMLVNLFK